MPRVVITVEKNGEVNMDYEGFVGVECHMKEQDIVKRIRNLQIVNIGETSKDFEDRMLEVERE